jgi:hypothetical protein
MFFFSFFVMFVDMICFSFRVGIDIPTIEVRYERLTVEAEAYVGSRALPTFTNFTIGAVEVNLSCKILPHQFVFHTLTIFLYLVL